MATLKSDSLHTVILRGFEFTLKETTIFRAGPYATGKNKAPQVREAIIGEQKVPVNVTLYGGTQHKAELACIVPHNHTTTSLNSARHIDITYIIYVRALMGTGTHLVMELPVIITNWPKAQSIVAVKRIGTAPSLSLGHIPEPSNTHQQNGLHAPQQSRLPDRSSTAPISPLQFNTVSSLPNKGFQPGPDEFGYDRPEPKSAATVPNRGSAYYSEESPSQASELRPSIGRRVNSNRFTITNIGEEDLELQATESPPTTARSPRTPWLSAEEEKKRLYEEANAKVAQVQGAAARPPSPVEPSPPISQRTPTPPIPVVKQPSTPPRKDSGLLLKKKK
jgi:hypothetical protein